MSESSAVTPLRRPRGRPPKLSAAMILQAAGDLLADTTPEQLTLSRVAEQLGVPATSVYNYFPNRDALLSALAESLFAQFRFEEPPELEWPLALMAWMRAVDGFLLEHPVGVKVMGRPDGETSPAWMEVRAPLFRILKRAGLEGLELATVAIAVHSQLIGFLFILPYATRPQPNDNGPPDEHSETMRNEAEIRRARSQVRREDLLQFGLGAILEEVRRRARR